MKSRSRVNSMKEKILIVDDESDVATYLATALRANGYSPAVADNVDSGIGMAYKLQPDLICLDIMMPRKSGLTMYTRLKKDPALRDIPVLIISGVGQEGRFDFQSFIEDESIPAPSHYMEKPINIDDYLKVVRRLIGAGRNSKRRASRDA